MGVRRPPHTRRRHVVSGFVIVRAMRSMARCFADISDCSPPTTIADRLSRSLVHVSVHVECSVTACHFRRFDSCFPQSPEDSSCHFGHFKRSLLTLPSVLLVFTLCLSRYLYFLIYLTVRDTILYEYASSQFQHLHKHA